MRVQSGLSPRHTARSARVRGGYTLVELVVVMGIIAALAALILGAVAKVKDSGDRTKVRSELSQLDTAVAAFKADHGFNPPQEIEFPFVPTSGPGAGAANVAQQKAAQALAKMFRGYEPTTDRITFRGAAGTSASQPLKLKGIQSLVFFLGGPSGTGFKKTKPVAADVDSNSKTGPYYDFAEARFIDPEDRTGPNIYDYRDLWGTPYAYFSSGTAGGDKYDSRATWPIPDRSPGVVLAAFRLGGTATSPWANPGRVQIISAGPDKFFGQAYQAPQDPVNKPLEGGNLWVPGQGEYSDLYQDPITKGTGADDLANFNGTAPLGTPGN